MPSALATTRSIGVVTNPRTRSAFAPTYTVVICTTAMSLRGYCRTLNERIAYNPAIRMTRLTTIASTGRFTNRSVNFMDAPHKGRKTTSSDTPFLAGSARSGMISGAPFSRVVAREMGTFFWCLTIFRFRIDAVTRFHVVVHQNRRAIPQLEYARAHHFFAGIQSGNNRHLIATRSLDFHHLLSHSSI